MNSHESDCLNSHESDSYKDPFKRLNFFHGLFTTAANWQTEQNYHRGRQALHNRLQHWPGVVNGLQVEVVGPRAVRVAPGHAIDSLGRELSWASAEEQPVPNECSSGLSYVYVILEEHRVEENRDPTSPDQKRVYVAEKPVIKFSRGLPETGGVIIARLNLLFGQNIIKDQIDYLGVNYAAARVATLLPNEDGGQKDLDKPEDAWVIEDFTSLEEAARYSYVATVIASDVPADGSPTPRLSWSIETLRTKEKVSYYLRIKSSPPCSLQSKIKYNYSICRIRILS